MIRPAIACPPAAPEAPAAPPWPRRPVMPAPPRPAAPDGDGDAFASAPLPLATVMPAANPPPARASAMTTPITICAGFMSVVPFLLMERPRPLQKAGAKGGGH